MRLFSPGLILSVLILYFFLEEQRRLDGHRHYSDHGVDQHSVAMKLANMSFNMMTLGGIAASIGLVIDNAIIVVEAMWRQKFAAGRPRLVGIQEAIGEIFGTPRRLDPDAGGCVHPAGDFIRRRGCVFPRLGIDYGRIAAHVTGFGAHPHAVTGRVVYPRP